MRKEKNGYLMPVRVTSMNCLCTLALLVLYSTISYSQTIDFEDESYSEGDKVAEQYWEQDCGVQFYIGSEESGKRPVIAEVGGVSYSAFQGPNRSEPNCNVATTMVDMPATNQGVGCKFLTDDGQVRPNPEPLIIVYRNAATKASGELLDIDGQEEWTITAYNGTSQVGTPIILKADPTDPTTGDGIATYWEFSSVSMAFNRIEIQFTGNGNSVGLAFDNFSACSVREEEVDSCAGIAVSDTTIICKVSDDGSLYYEICFTVTNNTSNPIVSAKAKQIQNGLGLGGPANNGVFSATYSDDNNDGVNDRYIETAYDKKLPVQQQNGLPLRGPNPAYSAKIIDANYPLVRAGETSNFCLTVHPQVTQGGDPRIIGGDQIRFNVEWELTEAINKDCIKCEDSFMSSVPNCQVPIDCCPAEMAATIGRTRVRSNNLGETTVQIPFSAGLVDMQSVQISLINTVLNGNPAGGSIEGGAFHGGGAISSDEQSILFGTWTICKDLSASQNIVLDLDMPAYEWPGPCGFFINCPDKLDFSLKVEYTDCNCRRCDTILHFTARRRNLVGGDKFFNRLLIGTLTGPNTGRLTVNLPVTDTSLNIVYQGIELITVDSGVAIAEIGGSQAIIQSASEGRAVVTFNSNPGDKLSFDIRYNNFGDRLMLSHVACLSYLVNGESFRREIPITFLRQEVEDLLTGDEEISTNVKTFALHLQNTNSTQQLIAQIAIRVPSGQRILAIGPTANDSTAVIGFRKRDEEGRYVPTEVRGEEVLVPVDSEVSPIYLTVAGVEGDGLTVDFITLNAAGEVISEDEVSLITSSVMNDDRAVTGSFLSQSYPNPTDGTATIEFMLPRTEQNVELVVTDQQGNEVARLIDNTALYAGTHVVLFNGTNLPSGTYYYTLRTESGTETKRLQLVK